VSTVSYMLYEDSHGFLSMKVNCIHHLSEL
jgi:hypothetical protein